MRQSCDYIGSKFGFWTVKEKVSRVFKSGTARAYWLCICKCGKEKSVSSTSLVSGCSTSCGCSKITDLTGKVFHYLTVQYRVKSRGHCPYWSCICKCGKVKDIAGTSLTTGHSRSCGCLRWGMAASHCLFLSYRKGAVKRNLPFHLDETSFLALTKQNYCGAIPSQKTQPSGTNGEYIYSGIDRVDNTLGYETSNVVPCCRVCNVMKWTNTYESFIMQCKHIMSEHDKRTETQSCE